MPAPVIPASLSLWIAVTGAASLAVGAAAAGGWVDAYAALEAVGLSPSPEVAASSEVDVSPVDEALPVVAAASVEAETEEEHAMAEGCEDGHDHAEAHAAHGAEHEAEMREGHEAREAHDERHSHDHAHEEHEAEEAPEADEAEAEEEEDEGLLPDLLPP